MDSNEIILNKNLIKKYGLEMAVILTELKNKSEKSNEQFEYSITQIENDTSVARWRQNQAIKKIVELGFAEVEFRGMPAKRYFKINYEKLPDCLKEQAKQEHPKNQVGQAQLPALKTTSKPKAVLNKQEQSDFEQLWSQYPNKQGKQKALTAYKKAVKDGATFDEIMQGIQNYKFYIEQKGIEQEYIKHGSTWFNQRGWEDDYTVIERQPIKKKPRYETVDEKNNRVFAEFLKDEDLSDLPQVYEDCLKGLTEGFHV